jgi:hypothetical protein
MQVQQAQGKQKGDRDPCTHIFQPPGNTKSQRSGPDQAGHRQDHGAVAQGEEGPAPPRYARTRLAVVASKAVNGGQMIGIEPMPFRTEATTLSVALAQPLSRHPGQEQRRMRNLLRRCM